MSPVNNDRNLLPPPARDTLECGPGAETTHYEESLERLAAIVESSDDAIIGKTLEGTITSWNKGAEKIYGYAEEEVVGRPVSLLAPTDRPDEIPQILERIRRGDRVERIETARRTKDGSLIEVALTVSPIRDRSGEIVGASSIARNIGERKQLEEQLRQAQKMEAVGRLAGGVAHDFNNLLTAINGYADLALRKLDGGDPLCHNLEEIRKAGERAAGLTRQLLAFGRKQILRTSVINLNEIVANMTKMLRRLIGEDVELRASLDMHLGQIRADPGQIEQVLMNLVVNARDAMPGGGRLTIQTGNVMMDEEVARRYVSVQPGRHVLLSVTDTGTGMDEETKAHIFEPFFTTKGLGEGTGLGLSTVYGIIKQSGGYITVESREGEGTTFIIYLPRVDEAAAEEEPQEEPPPRGSEVVLLVDDAELVRDMTRAALEESGYTVLAAASGADALEVCKAREGSIHLLITDVVMPGMSGRNLAERAVVMRPGMKVLYISGYTDDVVVRHGVQAEETPFLQKPFSFDALARKVRETLDAR